LLKSRASLTYFRASFLPGLAKDLSAPRYDPTPRHNPHNCHLMRSLFNDGLPVGIVEKAYNEIGYA